jgi:hypothetical protein
MIWGENASNLSASPASDKIATGQKGPITVSPSKIDLALDKGSATIKVKADIDDELTYEVKDTALIDLKKGDVKSVDGIKETEFAITSKGQAGGTTITFKGHKDGQEVSATCTVKIAAAEEATKPEDDNPIISMLRGIFGDAAPVVLVIAIVVIVIIIILILVFLIKSKKNRRTAKKVGKTAKKAYKAYNKRRK